jgi:endonuclease/exonuclease/phosphatase family metal-dependent hydrolase
MADLYSLRKKQNRVHQKYRRVITKAVLEEKATGKQFVAFSIHTNGEHYGLQEINYAMERVLPVLETGLPTYFTGDFNVLPTSDTYALIAQHMNDARQIAKAYGNNGVTTTVSRRIIDFIWCSKDNITVDKFDVLDEPIYPMGWVEKYASDHLAVVAEISF